MFTNWTGGTNLPLDAVDQRDDRAISHGIQPDVAGQLRGHDQADVEHHQPDAGQRLSNATFTVKGTASDNWMVSNVWCQINGLGWNPATNINHWTNWAAGVTLIPGTNVVQAYAVDTSGNVSTTNSVSFQLW